MSQKKSIRSTSWSDLDLLRLCEPDTHRIWFDGYEFWWQQNLDGMWTPQCIKSFDDYATAYSYLVYNLASWKNEYDHRVVKKRKKELRKIRNNAARADKVAKILSSQASQRDKVIQLVKLLPDSGEQDLADLLQLSQRAVRRYIKTSNK